MRLLYATMVISFASSTASAFAQNCVDEKMLEIENRFGEAQALVVSGNMDLGGCKESDFPEVHKCGESLSETRAVILNAPDGYSLNKATVLATKTHNASDRWSIGDISFLTSEDGAIRSAAVNISCSKENKIGGGGCEISIALSGTAEPFIGLETLTSIIEECRAQS